MAGNQQTFTHWQSSYDPWRGETAADLGPTPYFRNQKDQALARWGQSPDVQHPDGYLGTQGSTTRRSDKLLDAVARQNHRSYSRGVHKGERINPGDYMWPDELNLESGLKRQVDTAVRHKNGILVERQGPVGAEPVVLTNDGKAGPRGIPRNLERPELEPIDKNRAKVLSTLVPSWR